jgi:hypothetical protein
MRKAKGYAFKRKVDWYNTYTWIADKKNEKAGVVYTVDDHSGKVAFHVGVREKTTREQHTSSAPAKETAEQKAQRLRDDQQREASIALDKTLAAAVAGDPALAVRLAVMAALIDTEDAGLPFGYSGCFSDSMNGDTATSPDLPAKLAGFFTKGRLKAKADLAGVWKAAKALTDNQVLAILAWRVAQAIETPAGEIGVEDLLSLILDDFGVEVPDVMRPTQADIEETSRKSKKKAAE